MTESKKIELNDETRALLLGILSEDDWKLVWGCFEEVQFRGEGIESAARVRGLLKWLLQIKPQR